MALPIDELSKEDRQAYDNLWWRIDLLPQNIDYLGSPSDMKLKRKSFIQRIKDLLK